MKFSSHHIAFAAVFALAGMGASAPAHAADPLFEADSATYSWGGFHVGAGVGYRDMSADAAGTPFVELSDDSAVVGLSAGYDVQFDRTVIGLIGELTFGDQTSSFSNGAGNWSVSTGPSGAVKGRVGFAFDNLLPYATAGVAFTDVETSFTPAGLATQSRDETLAGWTVGAGVEYGINENWSLKLDYSYADFGSETFRYTAPGGPTSYDISTHTVMFGTNLRF